MLRLSDDLRLTEIMLIYMLNDFLFFKRNTNRRLFRRDPNSVKLSAFLYNSALLLYRQRGMTWTHIVRGLLRRVCCSCWAPFCYEWSLVRPEDLLALYYSSSKCCLAIPICSEGVSERWSAKRWRDLGSLVDKLILGINTVIIVSLLCRYGSIVLTVVINCCFLMAVSYLTLARWLSCR